MSSIAPPKAAVDFRPQASATPASPSPIDEAVERRMAEHAAAMRSAILPDKLQVRLDESAGRFVQTLTDESSAETLRRYPSETQLAYSRAVMAYLRAAKG